MRKFLLIALSLFALPALSANLYVAEFTSAPPTVVIYQAAKTPAIRETRVPITGGSVQSLVFTPTTGLVRLHCDLDCQVAFSTVGGNASATIDSMRLVAGATEYFVVTPGMRLAVIQATVP